VLADLPGLIGIIVGKRRRDVALVFVDFSDIIHRNCVLSALGRGCSNKGETCKNGSTDGWETHLKR
jgi:hypothetical protein